MIEATKPISNEEARRLVAGKTEKGDRGVDPGKHYFGDDDTRHEYRIGEVPLAWFVENMEGDLYDSTVHRDRAEAYSKRDKKDVPPVIAVPGRKSGMLGVLDGGHRLTAARLRGDTTILAIIGLKKTAGA